MGQLRSCHRASTRIADHRREVADDENGFVSSVLKIPQLRKGDAVAEMNVRRGRIDAQLHAERTAEFQFCVQIFEAEDFGGTAGKEIDIGHVKYRSTGFVQQLAHIVNCHFFFHPVGNLLHGTLGLALNEKRLQGNLWFR